MAAQSSPSALSAGSAAPAAASELFGTAGASGGAIASLMSFSVHEKRFPETLTRSVVICSLLVCQQVLLHYFPSPVQPMFPHMYRELSGSQTIRADNSEFRFESSSSETVSSEGTFTPEFGLL